MHYIEPQNKDQLFLDSHIDRWLSEDNPVRLIDLIIDKIVSSNPDNFIWKGQSILGRKSYSPVTMLKLFLYGYLNQISSSRLLEKETHRNIELIWLLGQLKPDFKTIADYRRDNADHIRHITLKFREFLKDNKYIDGQQVGFDGSKIKANACRGMLSLKRINERLNNTEKKLDRYLKEFQQSDILEDIREELACQGADTDPNMLLIEKIAGLQEELETLKEKKDLMQDLEQNHYSETDPDAKMMKMQGGKMPGYNLQTSVDKKHKLIATAEITTDQCDIGQLEPNLNRLKHQLDIEPDEALADKGYSNTQQIEKIESSTKTRCYIPLEGNHQNNKDKENGIGFTYDKQKDQFICSEGKILKSIQKNIKGRNDHYDQYQGVECGKCKIKDLCTKSKKGRIIKVNKRREWIDKYKHRINLPYAKEKIRERKALVEHPFGTLKYMMGKIPLLLRGRLKVQAEIDLYTTAYNIKRMINIENVKYLIELVNSHNWRMAI